MLTSNAFAAASTGSPFYGSPPDDHHAWAVHDQNRPQPIRITPGTLSSADKPGQPPSDAIVLFDGTHASLAKWESDPKNGVAGPTQWIVNEGAMECVPKSGYVRTKDQFGDCQLHIEWAAPKTVKGDSQGRGNSGIFLMGLVEIQVLDNYDNPTYADGFAASVYGVNPPMANALRPPGKYQMIDIVFRRPVYKGGKVLDPGYVTVFCNGVLVQDHTPLEGPTGHMKRTVAGPLPEKGPLKLQDHGNPVRFRNIWYRPLPPRTVEGNTDGWLSKEAAVAKRRETAATLRSNAAQLATDSDPQMFRLAESLVYDKDSATLRKVEQLAGQFANRMKALSSADRANKKDEITFGLKAFQYLTTAEIVPAGFGPKKTLEQIVQTEGWDKEKKK